MKTLFKTLQSKNPYLSSLVVFNNMIIDKKIKTKKDVLEYFKLVDKKDYMKRDKEDIINHSISLLKRG